MAASTASMWRRSEPLSVHSQSRSQAASRERGDVMTVTLARRSAAPPTATAAGFASPLLMEKFLIEGGVPLSGTVVPAGNKNGALPILAASVLTEDEVVIGNVPRIADVDAMLGILADLGVRVDWRSEGTVALCAADVDRHELDRGLAERVPAAPPRRPAEGDPPPVPARGPSPRPLGRGLDAPARGRGDGPPPARPAPR